MIDLHHGDCLDVMPTLEAGSIDLTVTSPPYDNLRTYNDSLDWGEHVWKPVLENLYRLTKEGGVVVWIVGDATIKGSETGTSFKQALYAMECGFRLHDTMIYEKDACPFPETNRYYPYFEYMFVLCKGRPNTCNQIADKPNRCAGQAVSGKQRNPDGTTTDCSAVRNKTGRSVKKYGVRGNVWRYNVGKWKVTADADAYNHPAIFPESLARDHIISWSNEGDTVFDPFLGSGTTGKMALEQGRNFVGIEKDAEYFEIAKKRIDDAQRKDTTQ